MHKNNKKEEKHYCEIIFCQLKFFGEVIAAGVTDYRQKVLPHSNLLYPHFRSQFAFVVVIILLQLEWMKCARWAKNKTVLL